MNKWKKKHKQSSKEWLKRHFSDPFVKEAHAKGYRSRAAFKLLQIQNQFKILQQKQKVLDLGCAPGGWAQVASQYGGQVTGIDLLEMDEISGVNFIQQDFSTWQSSEMFDLILSDMAPNTTGNSTVDHLRIIALAEDVWHFAKSHLNTNGHLICKIRQGGAQGELLQELKRNFATLKHFKPEASRKGSCEIYIVALNML